MAYRWGPRKEGFSNLSPRVAQNPREFHTRLSTDFTTPWLLT